MSRPSHAPPRSRRGAPEGKLDALLRILDLEEQIGFSDGAVIGGLDEFLNRWRKQLATELGRSPIRGVYGTRSVESRREWARRIRDRVADGANSPSKTARPKTATYPPPIARRKRDTKPRKVELETPVTDLPFIRRPTAEKLARMEVRTLRDLVYLFPFRHVDYANVTPISDLELGMETTVVASVWTVERKRIGPGRGATQAIVTDGTGRLEAIWFQQPYLADRFKQGTRLTLSGKIQAYRNRARLQNPEYEVLDGQAGDELVHAGVMLPVYPSTEGLLQRTLRNAARKAVDAGLSLLEEWLPDDIRRRQGFPTLQSAIRNMHSPETVDDQKRARERLAFDELFSTQLGVQKRRADWRTRGEGVAVNADRSIVDPFLASLPFQLTGEQNAALDEILSEMASNVPMARLLQGEVGSGKTVVAIAALLAVAGSRLQGALMAPTEVLTEQHFLNLTAMLSATRDEDFDIEAVRIARVPGIDAPVRIALLTGSMSRSAKSEIHRLLAASEISIVIGTHALQEESVEIPELALAVVDEQHRFGVQQRAALRGKGWRPHLLAMSATPIPRSLALTLYGDLDLSTLRELPAGRRGTETRWMRSAALRREAYETVRSEVAQGRQAFVVCPLIEESDQIEARAATIEYARLLTGEFRALEVGLLHGRMSLSDKQQAMRRFRARDIDVLVATPVIEVGIDVPNATVMVIESADRFGLSQLHQLRGRVGRGEFRSQCLLLADDAGGDARERLAIIESTPDGFELAEEDLRIRGPGDYLGARQSGFPELKVATLSDTDLLAIARAEAADVLATDPGLSSTEHAALRKEMERAGGRSQAEIS